MVQATVVRETGPDARRVDWVSPADGALGPGWRRAERFDQQLRAMGGACLTDPAMPSVRAIAAGVVMPGPEDGTWLWRRSFVSALEGHAAGLTFLGETPDAAGMLFGTGLEALSGDQVDVPDDVRDLVRRFARTHDLRDACIGQGAGVALRLAMDAYARVMTHVDGRARFVVTGMAKVGEAFAKLRRMTDRHPLVRFGLVPGPGAFPDPVNLSPGKGGGSLADLARMHGFPLPFDSHGYGHRDLFALWVRGVPLAVIHRNGRDRLDAVEAVMMTEAFGALGLRQVKMRQAEFETFNVAPDAVFAARPVRAPRRRLS